MLIPPSARPVPSVVFRSSEVGDPSATRTVYVIVVVLVVIGVAFLGIAIWLFRQTRVDAELLAPLERMDTRRWRKADPAGQRRLLDEARPADAEPLHRAVLVPDVDAEFADSDRPVPNFDDFVGVSVAPERPATADREAEDDAVSKFAADDAESSGIEPSDGVDAVESTPDLPPPVSPGSNDEVGSETEEVGGASGVLVGGRGVADAEDRGTRHAGSEGRGLERVETDIVDGVADSTGDEPPGLDATPTDRSQPLLPGEELLLRPHRDED